MDEILASLGTSNAAAAIGELSTLDAINCERLLLSPPSGSGGERAAYEDWVWLLCEAARCWPNRYVSTVLANPHLLSEHPVVAGLGCIPGSDDLLVTAVQESGSSWARGTALAALIGRSSAKVPDLLLTGLSDRDWNPRFEAICASIELGDPRLLDRLTQIAADPAMGQGEREYAQDAIEAISRRFGLEVSSARLLSLHPPSTDAMVLKVHVGTSHSVDRGQLMLELSTGLVLAPCDGVVVSVLAVAGTLAPATIARIRVEGQQFVDQMPD